MGLLNQLRTKLTGDENWEVQSNNTDSVPPSYHSANEDSGANSSRRFFGTGKSILRDIPEARPDPFVFTGAPYAQTITFNRPVYDWRTDTSVADKRKNKTPQPRVKTFDVNLSIPKTAISSDVIKDKTADLFLHIEIPQEEISEMIIEAKYEAYVSKEEETKPLTEAPKTPWVVNAALIGMDKSQRGNEQSSVVLMAEGRFSSVGKWYLSMRKPQSGSAPISKPVLPGGPVAICATAAYNGPMIVSFRIGVVCDRYTSGEFVQCGGLNREVVWKTLSQPVLVQEKGEDFITGYIHAVNSKKLLTL